MFDEDFLPSSRFIQSICGGLVIVDEQSGIVRLIHRTAHQYLEKTRDEWFPGAHVDIANTCVTYLSFNVFDTGFCQSDQDFEARLRAYPLSDYAAKYWGYHASEANLKELDGIIAFLKSDSKVLAACQAMMVSKSRSNGHPDYSQEFPKDWKAIHIAAYFGLSRAVMALLDKGADVDPKDMTGRTPLLLAAKKGHEAVINVLLEKGADINSTDTAGRTPLSIAAENGHDGVVLLLHSEGTNANPKDTAGPMPLSFAVISGRK